MLSNARAALRAWPVRATLLLLAAYAGALALPGIGLSRDVVNGMGLLTVWASAGVCWLAVWRVGLRRWEVLLPTVALTSYAAGLTYYTAVLALGGTLTFPSPADLISLLFYPLMLGALVAAVRHHMQGLAAVVWWDCAVGSLGAVTVLAVVLRPVLDSAATGTRSWATVMALVPPMFDLLLVAAVAGVAALPGVRMGGRWALLVSGLLVFATTDVVYSLQVSKGVFVAGTPLDAGWAIGFVLIAMWVDDTAQNERTETKEPPPTSRVRGLFVSSAATAAGLGVLVVDAWIPQSTPAVVLAGVTLLVAAVRTQVAFLQLGRMSDERSQQANTDPLTGLWNRRALYAEGRARQLEPHCGHQALLMLDLDKFKEVNDSLGHIAGDQLLVEVGTRLREQVRDGDLLVRLGGDEFAVLLKDAGREEASAVAGKLRAAMAGSFVLEGVTLHSSVSIGITVCPDDGPDLSTLLRKADIAMYKAKASGDGVHFYGRGDHIDGSARLRMVEELRTALTCDQLVMHYQPKIDLNTGDVHSVEALVRWDHPTRGLLYPDAFLALVEENGLMPALTRTALTLALDEVASCPIHGRQLTIAVNLSASSLVDVNLPEEVAAMLADRGLQPRALQLEVTEEFLMTDRERARDILTRLRNSGIQISLDDFGTGYSSLSYLRDLPIDELKLDRSFVLPMADDARAAALVASTIRLAHSLGLRIVAEGIENQVAYTQLARMGCDQAQGHFMCRPIPIAELHHWLNRRPAVHGHPQATKLRRRRAGTGGQEPADAFGDIVASASQASEA